MRASKRWWKRAAAGTCSSREIPYGVQKGKLIEQIAELIAEKKLPILADVRDESAEDLRIVLEPRARTVDAELLEESLYRLTDLEVRFPLNLNVLDENRTPVVMSLKEALSAWLKFQIEVLVRKSQVRIGKIDDRLELLDGFLIAYLNLDRVIEIIRTEDEPKPILMAEFSLADRQAEAILNMRLRSLRRLEEMEIGREREKLAKEREELEKLVADPGRQRRRLKKDLAAIKDQFGDDRRTRIEEVAPTREIDWSAMIEKEPITVILSQRGLDPGDARPCRARRCRDPEIPRGRRAGDHIPRADDRSYRALRRERPGLHARRGQVAGRPRFRRAGAAFDRSRRRGRHRGVDGDPARRRSS